MQLGLHATLFLLAGFGLSTAALTEEVTAGFVFDGTRVVNSEDRSQSLAVWDKISPSELERRFPGFTVKRVTGDCGGQCFYVSRTGTSFRVDFGGEKQFSFYRIVSDAKSSRDAAGHMIGSSLAKAIGATRAKCDDGETTSCQSKSVMGLAYLAGGCPLRRSENGDQYSIPACATVDGFEISRVRKGGKQ